MKKTLTIIVSILITSLSSFSQTIDMKDLISVVTEIKTISQKDSGKFWNIIYETPLLFVNPENRQTFVFDIGKEPYSVQLEDTIPIGNTCIYWNGKLWAMIGLPLPEHPYEYETLILHEMFHALQPQLGFNELYEMPCAHLEEEKGAVLLRLELQALLKALEQSNNKDSLYKHLTNALTFRNSRHIIYPKAKAEENAMELNEGMAEYTMFMMSHIYSQNKFSERDLIKVFQSHVSFFERDQRSSRSFAYTTILLYGYLIQIDIPNWHQKVTSKTNLTDYFMQIINMSNNEEEVNLVLQHNEKEVVIININDFDDNEINISSNEGMITFFFDTNNAETNVDDDNEDWKDLAFQYNYESIVKEEYARSEQKNAEKDSIKQRFLCANHVEIHLFEYSYSFDPFNFMIIDGVGVFYKNMTLFDSWGKVETSNGLILDTENRKVILSPIIKKDKNVFFGEGWKLILNDGWDIKSKQNYTEVVKK